MARISPKKKREKARREKSIEIARRKANGERPTNLFFKVHDLDFIDEAKAALGVSSRADVLSLLIEQARQSGFLQPAEQGDRV